MLKKSEDMEGRYIDQRPEEYKDPVIIPDTFFETEGGNNFRFEESGGEPGGWRSVEGLLSRNCEG